MIKAYKDETFMNSPAARPLRILAEYAGPEARLAQHQINRAITFWGSARLRPGKCYISDGRDYYAMTRELGARLARWTLDTHPPGERFHILTGGGPGIMEAAHEGAAQVDRTLNVGFNISLPREQGSNPYIPTEQVFEFHYFFMRKFWFAELSSVLIVLPGGFGTMDELAEMLTLMQTGKSPRRPVILFGRDFWTGVLDLHALAAQRLISPDDLELVHFVDEVDEAFEALLHLLDAASLP